VGETNSYESDSLLNVPLSSFVCAQFEYHKGVRIRTATKLCGVGPFRTEQTAERFEKTAPQSNPRGPCKVKRVHRSRRRHKSRNTEIGSLHKSLVAQQRMAARNPKRILPVHSMPGEHAKADRDRDYHAEKKCRPAHARSAITPFTSWREVRRAHRRKVDLSVRFRRTSPLRMNSRGEEPGLMASFALSCVPSEK